MAEETASEQQPVDVEAPASVTEEAPVVEQPEETQLMTPDQVAEHVSRGTNEIKSWIGRRDKDLLNQIGGIIEDRISKKVETPEDLSNKLLEDPVNTIKQIMSETQTAEQTKSQRHGSETLEYIGNMMDSDPLYEDKDLGGELIEEVKKQFQSGKVDTRLSPEAAAKVLQAEALSNVMRGRKKENALVKNKPGSGAGTLTPGIPSTKKGPKVPDLTEETKKWADKWGYSQEDLARVYGDS
jgi:hypothetical protein